VVEPGDFHLAIFALRTRSWKLSGWGRRLWKEDDALGIAGSRAPDERRPPVAMLAVGKPLVGPLAGYYRITATGDRYRIIYQLNTWMS
jgi:hypothetical protein